MTKASELKPGEFFDSPYSEQVKERRYLVVDRHEADQQLEVFHRASGQLLRYHFNNPVTPLPNVHGWDDEPEQKLWIVELENNVWLASGEGDPPRTLDRRNALEFCAYEGAQFALRKARKYRPFVNAVIWDKSKVDDNPTIVDEPAPLQLREDASEWIDWGGGYSPDSQASDSGD